MTVLRAAFLTLLVIGAYLKPNAQLTDKKDTLIVPLLDSILFKSDSRIIKIMNEIVYYNVYTNERILSNFIKTGGLNTTDSLLLQQTLLQSSDAEVDISGNPFERNQLFDISLRCVVGLMEQGLLLAYERGGTKLQKHGFIVYDSSLGNVDKSYAFELGKFFSQLITIGCRPVKGVAIQKYSARKKRMFLRQKKRQQDQVAKIKAKNSIPIEVKN